MAHALEVAFDCDGERMKLEKETEGVDKKTGSKFLEASVRIKKGQVLDQIVHHFCSRYLDVIFQVLDTLEDYTCVCRANSTKGEVESDPAVVNLACKSNYFTLIWTVEKSFGATSQENVAQNITEIEVGAAGV